MKRQASRTSILLVLIGLPFGMAGAQVTFTERADEAGVLRSGKSYGLSWGDVNGDGLPDVWLGNHQDDASLFVNQGDGTFVDEAPSRAQVLSGDKHGAGWADFDNDGDQDLLVTTASPQANQFHVNEGGSLTEQAAAYEIDVTASRGRSITWLDWNRDGVLDVLFGHAVRNNSITPVLLNGMLSSFSDATNDVGLSDVSFVAAYLAEITNDGSSEVFLSTGNPSGGGVYDVSGSVWNDLAVDGSGTDFETNIACTDSVLADFNGDGEADIFSVCGTGSRELNQRGDGALEARLFATAEEVAVEFVTDGIITIDIYPQFILDTSSNLIVGNSGYEPEIGTADPDAARAGRITLDPDNPGLQGTPVHDPGSDLGLFIDYDDQSSRWRIAFSAPFNLYAAFIVTPSPGDEITDIVTEGFDAIPAPSWPIFLVRSDDDFVNSVVESGLNRPLGCRSAAGGDFDNDMDVDIYLACTRYIVNLPNVLLLNDGNGKFTDAGPVAAGTLEGGGDAVATADYDQDGFLDLFVVNGRGHPPFNDGPNQLFHNDGNDNHWIQLDLVGSVSNRDAIGSIARVTAGGVEQKRILDGGFHARAQDFKRLHFGLGTNTTIENLEIQWVSGAVSTFTGVEADRVITINEDGTSDIDGDGVIDINDQFPGDATESVDTDADGIGNDADDDDDGDTLPDDYELENSLNPLDASDGNGDPDADGLSNLEERDNGTDPQNFDSDGDGFSDGAEVNAGTAPNDPDSMPDSTNDEPEPDPGDDSSSDSQGGSGSGGGAVGVPALISMLLLSVVCFRKRAARQRPSNC